jgi:membrane-bound lytic murein transglycosylase B
MIAVAVLALAGLAAHAKMPEADWSYAEKKLKKAGLRASYIRSLKSTYDPADFKSAVELNCLLFLRKTDYHGPQVSPEAVEMVKNFVHSNQATFDSAEDRFGVSPTVIAGLLWMESRFGENQGKFHVGSALVDLIQADRAEVIRHLQKEASPRFTEKLSRKDKKAIAEKARVKAKWAMSELKAMQKMYRRDPELAKNLKGSFAGAFGMPQFEPSSYVPYARSPGTAAPDLTKPEDAIYSVANYLRESGWRRGKQATYQKALLQYNHSQDYARAILKLAWQAEGLDPERIPASKSVKKKKKKRRA